MSAPRKIAVTCRVCDGLGLIDGGDGWDAPCFGCGGFGSLPVGAPTLPSPSGESERVEVDKVGLPQVSSLPAEQEPVAWGVFLSDGRFSNVAPDTEEEALDVSAVLKSATVEPLYPAEALSSLKASLDAALRRAEEAEARIKALAIEDYKAGQDIARSVEVEIAELQARAEAAERALADRDAEIARKDEALREMSVTRQPAGTTRDPLDLAIHWSQEARRLASIARSSLTSGGTHG